MAHEFDPGYPERYWPLLADHPGADVYLTEDFRVEWGPIFHRGRLDGSARVLVIGQDPAAHEAIARRILVGAAGQRGQGLLTKLGIDRSYVMINTFLYSVTDQKGGAKHEGDDKIVEYRHRWFDELAAANDFEAVIAFGGLAESAFKRWAKTHATTATFVRFIHPTFPESAAASGQGTVAENTLRLLENWNAGLATLADKVTPDVPRPLVPYGATFMPEDLTAIPEADLPPGAPPWMRSIEEWAWRRPIEDKDGTVPLGVTNADGKRAGIAVRVPPSGRIWM